MSERTHAQRPEPAAAVDGTGGRGSAASTGRYGRRRFLLAAPVAAVAAGRLLRGSIRPAAAWVPGPRPALLPPGRWQADAGTAVVQWNSAALQAVAASTLGPPMVARALAILHTCIYDAWALYDAVAVPTMAATAPQPAPEQTAAAQAEALSFAAYAALIDLFPSQAALFTTQLAAQGYHLSDASQPGSAAAAGTQAAAAVLAYRHGDGSNQLGDLHPGAYTDYTGYQPLNTPSVINDPSHWQPLSVPNAQGVFNAQQYIGPFWGMVTPFAMTAGDQFRPAQGPAVYGTDLYKSQADQLLEISANLTDEQKVITEYWADTTGTIQPPGHWCLFAQTVSRRDGHDLAADVQMFFILGNALLDAGIACWEAKRVWDSERPITAVHYLYKGQQIRAWGGPFQGTVSMPGENWLSYQSPSVVTPAFPEFFSGHSTFSAAAAEVLLRFTGDDAFGGSATIPAGSSSLEPGKVPAVDLTLSWDTFSAAADQAGMSRRYGGIHFEQGDLTGRATGRMVAAQVWDRAQAYIGGDAL